MKRKKTAEEILEVLKYMDCDFSKLESGTEKDINRCPCCNWLMFKLKTGQWTHLGSEVIKEEYGTKDKKMMCNCDRCLGLKEREKEVD